MQMQGPIRRFLGPVGSPRRVRLRTLPALGPLLVAGVKLYRDVRAFRLGKQRELENRYTDFKNRRKKTAPNITRRNTRRAYERVYRDDRLLGEYLSEPRLDFYSELARLCAAERPRSVIDVGCGTGHLLHAVVEAADPKRVLGVDHASAGIRRARELVPTGEFRSESLYDLDASESFDLVLCTEVLEHLSKPDVAMRILARLCAPGGLMVITVPDGALDDWEGHRNFWGEPELASFLGSYGDVTVTRMESDPMSLLARVRPYEGGVRDGD